MYFYLKIGDREFSFGNDRKGKERRNDDKPVQDNHREVSERRKPEPDDGEDVEADKDKE